MQTAIIRQYFAYGHNFVASLGRFWHLMLVVFFAVCLLAWILWKHQLEREISAGELEENAITYLEEQFGKHMTILTNEIDRSWVTKYLAKKRQLQLYAPVDFVEIRDEVIDQKVWTKIQRFRELHGLTIQNCRIDSSVPVDFSVFPQLSSLTVTESPLTRSQIRGVTKLSHLNYLSIRKVGATPEWLKYITSLHQLTELDLFDIDVISEDDIKDLVALGQLKHLGLDGLRATTKSIAILAQLGNLTELVLVRAKIDHGSFGPLASLKNLKALYLNESDISDEDTKVLSKIPNLLWLSLADTRITENSLKNLLYAKRLYHLDLSHTQITAESLRKFLAAMPATLHWEVDKTQINEVELQQLREDFPGQCDDKVELELGYFD
jgi:hypothetical protein